MGTPVKISDLPAATALGGTEEVAGKQGTSGTYGGTVGILISQIGTYVRGLFTTTPATIAEGGTNAATAAAARTSLGVVNIAGDTLTGPLVFAATQPATDLITNVCDGRLTLTTGVPVTTADVTAAGTLYFTPYKGNRIALYDGAAHWLIFTFSELSLALTLTSGKPYDIFCYNNAGTLTLEVLVWTNDTTRATALALQNGVLVKTGATTRRYLGTLYASGSNITEDSLAKRYLWNYYNRVERPMRVLDATANWTYTTATWRQARATATNQLDYIQGYSEDPITAWTLSTVANSSAGVAFNTGIGLDSTSANSAQIVGLGYTQILNYYNVATAYYTGTPGVGRHTLSWLEASAATGTSTWYGTSVGGPGTTILSGIYGSIKG